MWGAMVRFDALIPLSLKRTPTLLLLITFTEAKWELLKTHSLKPCKEEQATKTRWQDIKILLSDDVPKDQQHGLITADTKHKHVCYMMMHLIWLDKSTSREVIICQNSQALWRKPLKCSQFPKHKRNQCVRAWTKIDFQVSPWCSTCSANNILLNLVWQAFLFRC